MKIPLILFFLLQTFVYICEQIILSQQYQQFKLITMKLNRLLTLPFFMLLLSCSSDWDLQPQSNDFVITVNASSAATSRADESAGVPAIEGYEFKCIMQLLDETGETVGAQSVVSMSSGSASFTITGENIDNGAVKAIFWAEYQPTAGVGKVYNTSDLKNITYKSTTFDLAAVNSTAVLEAFAGKLDKIEEGASVTLKRPVSKIVFSPKNRENVSDANSIEIKYVTASGYNVLDETASGTSEITLNKGSFDPQAEGAWFTTFMLCPANKSNAAGDITINLSGDNGYSRAITIPANSIPADPNHIYNITADITHGDISISVSVDSSWAANDANGGGDESPDPGKQDPEPDPNPGDDTGEETKGDTNYVLGSLIDANGYVTTDQAKAVAVYFQEGVFGNDNIENYPEYAEKKIKGYAIALKNISESPLTATMSNVVNYIVLSSKTGYNTTDKLLEYLSGCEFASEYIEWCTSHNINNQNITKWYIPADAQKEYMKLAVASTTFIQIEDIIGKDDANKRKYIFSITNSNKKFLYYEPSTYNSALTIGGNDYSLSTEVYCRPMVTIFTDATTE